MSSTGCPPMRVHKQKKNLIFTFKKCPRLRTRESPLEGTCKYRGKTCLSRAVGLQECPLAESGL